MPAHHAFGIDEKCAVQGHVFEVVEGAVGLENRQLRIRRQRKVDRFGGR